MRFLAAITITIMALVGSAPADAKRVALVIGNDKYENLLVLRKAVNDAEAMIEALAALNFDVISGFNLTRRETNRKLAEFGDRLSPGDEAFLFFSGHGVAIDGENYLIPRDMPQPRNGQIGLIEDEAHAVSRLVKRIQSRGVRTTFFVIDACRDNPFATRGIRNVGVSRGMTRVDAPEGVFLLYSAGYGQAALDRLSDDDDNPNSVFTRNLLPVLATPGLSHVDIAKRVQVSVSQLAGTIGHVQHPAYYDQILGEVVLRPVPDQPKPEPAPLKQIVVEESDPSDPEPELQPAAPEQTEQASNAPTGTAITVNFHDTPRDRRIVELLDACREGDDNAVYSCVRVCDEYGEDQRVTTLMQCPYFGDPLTRQCWDSRDRGDCQRACDQGHAEEYFTCLIAAGGTL